MATRAWDGGRNEAFVDRADTLRRLRRVARIARLMDTAVGIPGTRFRFGADSVLGLVPVVGDASGALIGLYIVNEARRLGLPADKLARMLGNLAADSVLGSVPLAGDVFDLFFKSHRRNVQMIFDHLGIRPDELR
jgi:hypothetical protein